MKQKWAMLESNLLRDNQKGCDGYSSVEVFGLPHICAVVIQYPEFPLCLKNSLKNSEGKPHRS